MPGRMKASRVQQLEPIRAISVEKLGITTTIRPLRITKPVLSAVWNGSGIINISTMRERREREREREREKRERGGRQEEEEKGREIYPYDIISIVWCITEHPLQDF